MKGIYKNLYLSLTSKIMIFPFLLVRNTYMLLLDISFKIYCLAIAQNVLFNNIFGDV